MADPEQKLTTPSTPSTPQKQSAPSLLLPLPNESKKRNSSPTDPTEKTDPGTNARQRRFSTKRSMSAPHFSFSEQSQEFQNASSQALTRNVSQSSRKADRSNRQSSLSDDGTESSKTRNDSINLLKKNVRKRRKSLVEHSDHTVTMKPNSRANFAPLQGSKFEEAFYLTLRRDQEAGKKKYLKQKYRGVRSDSQARKKRQRQEKKKNKRLAKGKQLKSKDIIDKTHDQFALTWGMMMGVQMSVGRQFEFSAKASSKSMNVDGKDSQNNKDSSTKVEGGNGNANEASPSHPKGLETKVSSTGSIDSHSSATSLSRKRNNSMQQAKELSMHMGVSAAVDEQTGELVTTPSMNEIRRQSQYSKHKTNGADLTAFTKAGGGAADTDTVSTTAVSTSTTATADSGDAVADKGSNKSTRRRPSNLRGDMDMFADSLKVTDFMAVDKYIFPLSIKGKERVCGLIATLVVATRRECCSHRVGLFFQILFLDCCFFTSFHFLYFLYFLHLDYYFNRHVFPF